jgi:heat shock protein HslJ
MRTLGRADARHAGTGRRAARRARLLSASLLMTTLGCAGSGAAGASPIGTLWQLDRIQMMDDTELRPDDPTRYTLSLGADGAVAVRADCNRGHGRHQLDGVQLRIGPLATTRMMCPAGSLGDRYAQLLDISASWMFVDGQLAIATAMDAAILFFSPAP